MRCKIETSFPLNQQSENKEIESSGSDADQEYMSSDSGSPKPNKKKLSAPDKNVSPTKEEAITWNGMEFHGMFNEMENMDPWIFHGIHSVK